MSHTKATNKYGKKAIQIEYNDTQELTVSSKMVTWLQVGKYTFIIILACYFFYFQVFCWR